MGDQNEESHESEAWARRALGRIVYAAHCALAPEGNRLGAAPNNKSQLSDHETYDTLFDALRIKGTRTIMVEDVGLLKRHRDYLVSSFDSLTNRLVQHQTVAIKEEIFFARLGELMNAAYYIGAYTTKTDRIHETVRHLNQSEHTKSLRERKARKNIGH